MITFQVAKVQKKISYHPELNGGKRHTIVVSLLF